MSLTDDQKDELIEKHAPPIHPDFKNDDGFENLVDAIDSAISKEINDEANKNCASS